MSILYDNNEALKKPIYIYKKKNMIKDNYFLSKINAIIYFCNVVNATFNNVI